MVAGVLRCGSSISSMTNVLDQVTKKAESSDVGHSREPVNAAKGHTMVEAYKELYSNLKLQSGVASQPAWLNDLRDKGFAKFEELGFPTKRNEDWHFTNSAPIATKKFDLRAEGASHSVTKEALEPFLFEGDWATIVFVNGEFDKDLSNFHRGNGRFFISTLKEATANDIRLVEQKLGGLGQIDINAFAALNTAFMQDGVFVGVSPNAVVDQPVHILYVGDSTGANTFVSPRTLIVADHHSEVTVVESFVSLNGAEGYFSNAVTEVYLAPGAQVKHYKVQRQTEDSFHVGSSFVYQKGDSNYESFSYAVGSSLSRTNIDTILDGDAAHATLNGLYMVDGDQVVDHQTRIEHVAPNCTSHEIYKGILDGSSQGVFNGKVYVHPEAQKTDGKQSNNNLILSDNAEVNTKPQLEIFADDVRCTHGATIGRLDENSLFYLKSRGISAITARKLLTYAFAAEVLEEMTIEPIKLKLEELAFSRFAE